MASLTKVTATTTAVAQFYQRGELPLSTFSLPSTPLTNQIPKSIPFWDPPGTLVAKPTLPSSTYSYTTLVFLQIQILVSVPNFKKSHHLITSADPSFGCPETSNYHPAENFSCQKQCYAAILATGLINPIGAVYLYSDLKYRLTYLFSHT